MKRTGSAAAADRNTRSLVALEKTASTSRVLNLLAVENSHSDTPEWAEAPFFKNRVLNAAIIIKHRLRADDQFLFGDFRASATKILIPFERTDLTLGGRSFFVGQRGWVELLNEACNNPPDLAYDLEILRLIDGLPSLDPFLVRESLRRAGFSESEFRFGKSHADYIVAARDHLSSAHDVIPTPAIALPGDLICALREGARIAPGEIARISAGESPTPMHCDLVTRVDFAGRRLEAIGGNVQQSVSRITLDLDEQGRVGASPVAGRTWSLVLRVHAEPGD